jgi:hypothetical protein
VCARSRGDQGADEREDRGARHIRAPPPSLARDLVAFARHNGYDVDELVAIDEDVG